MVDNLNSASALLRSLDVLIEKYGASHPELAKDLVGFREELRLALRKRNAQETAVLALRIASWVRYVVELFSDT